MNNRQRELAARRALLVAHAALQRVELAQTLTALRRPLVLFDHGLGAVRNLARHPHLLLALMLGVAIIRPWRMLGTVRRGWLLWRAALAVKNRLFG
ncbi:MAG: YqjK family protein [Pseudomonadota bacterium]